MAAKEGRSHRQRPPCAQAVVDVEVIDFRIGAQLTEWGSACRGDRGPKFGDSVGLADTTEPRTIQLGGLAGRTVRKAEQPAAETRLRQRESSPIATTWRQPASPPGAFCERRLVWLPDCGQLFAEGGG